jgi:hypothetical protein
VADGAVKLQLLTGSGTDASAAVVMAGTSTMTYEFVGGVKAAGFVVSAKSDVSIHDATVTQEAADSHGFRLDTPFQLALSTSSWRLSHTEGTFSVFRAKHVLAPDWLVRPVTSSQITSIRNVQWGDTWVAVKTKDPVVLERSEAYLPGWRATALNAKTGQVVQLPVERSGLIQKVTVPSGEWTVHFHYHAPYIELGLTASLVGALALVGAGAATWQVRRRNRGSRIPS